MPGLYHEDVKLSSFSKASQADEARGKGQQFVGKTGDDPDPSFHVQVGTFRLKINFRVKIIPSLKETFFAVRSSPKVTSGIAKLTV